MQEKEARNLLTSGVPDSLELECKLCRTRWEAGTELVSQLERAVPQAAVADFAQLGGERTDQPVAKQNAEKGADESRCDALADDLARTTERAESDDDTQDSGDNAQSRQRVSQFGERSGRAIQFELACVDVLAHDGVQFKRAGAGAGVKAEGVTHEGAGTLIGQEGRVLFENGTLRRRVYFVLQFGRAAHPAVGEELIQESQVLQVQRPSEWIGTKPSPRQADKANQIVLGIAYQKSTQGGTADDQKLRRLKENPEVAVFKPETGQNGCKHNGSAQKHQHTGRYRHRGPEY